MRFPEAISSESRDAGGPIHFESRPKTRRYQASARVRLKDCIERAGDGGRRVGHVSGIPCIDSDMNFGFCGNACQLDSGVRSKLESGSFFPTGWRCLPPSHERGEYPQALIAFHLYSVEQKKKPPQGRFSDRTYRA